MKRKLHRYIVILALMSNKQNTIWATNIFSQLSVSCGKERTRKEHTDIVFLVCVCVTQVARYAWNKADFDAVNPETTDYLMGESTVSSLHSHHYLCHLVSIMEDLVMCLTVKLRCDHNMGRVCSGNKPGQERHFLVVFLFSLLLFLQFSAVVFSPSFAFLYPWAACAQGCFFSLLTVQVCPAKSRPLFYKYTFFWLTLLCRSATVDLFF